MIWFLYISSVQSLSHVQLFVTPWTETHQTSLSNFRSLLKLMSIESVMPSDHLFFCRPLLLPSILPSIKVFSRVSSLYQVAKVLELQHQCFQWIFRTDFFRIDWLYLFAVQGTLKIPLQPHSSKASILQCSGFFIVQLSYTHMTTRKTIALTRQTFVSKVMSLLLNMLSRLISRERGLQRV